MAAQIAGYIKNIAFFLIFMSVIIAITPKNRYREYVALILSLILTFIVVSPLSALFSASSSADYGLMMQGALINREHEFYSEEEKENVLNTYKKELQKQAETLILAIDKNYSEVRAVVDVYDDERFGEIKSINLHISKGAISEKKSFIRIEEVRVDTPWNTPQNNISEEDETEKIKKAISDFYNVPLPNIYIIIKNT